MKAPRIFDSKDPDETDNLHFDFAEGLGGDTISGAPEVVCTLAAGADASPSALLNGAPSVYGSIVVQSVIGGVVNCDYRIEVRVNTTGSSPARKLVLAGILPVRDA
jgi:hypothetical protein